MLIVNRTFTLPIGQGQFTGTLSLPPQATGLVVIAHNDGSRHPTSRGRHVCRLLQQEDLGTFSIDLLHPQEKPQRQADVALLAQRLVATVKWMRQQADLLGLRIGLLGEAATAGAALAASTQLGSLVGAIVSFGGAAPVVQAAAPAVTAPTLLLVGARDEAGQHTGEQLQHALGETSQLRTVAQAGPLFQEPGTLAQAAQQAAAWFTTYLARVPRSYSHP